MIKPPNGWKLTPLGPLVASRSGNSKIIKGKQSAVPQVGLFQGYSASGPDVWVDNFEHEGEGIVVSAVGARCGKSFLADGKWTAIANTHTLKIKDPDRLDIKYLWYLCNDENWWIRSGTAQPFVSVSKTLERPQLLPPLPEQHKIVEILEDHLSRLDAALADVKQARVKAAQFKVAFLRKIFEGDETWSPIPMKQLGTWGGGGTPSKANEKFWTNGTIPWISPKDMGPPEITKTVDKITEEACVNSTVKKISMNSVVFVVRSGILERKLPMALTKVETTLNQDMKALTFSDGIHPKFGFYAMLGLEQDILRTCRKAGTTVASINTQSLMNYEIKIPSLSVQTEILDYVESQLTLVEKSVHQLEAVLNVADNLRRSLLQAAFTGQLTKEVASV
jgi:type I restriction enzyme S subunit